MADSFPKMTFLNAIMALSLLVARQTCLDQIGPRIVGGYTCDIKKTPFIVSIFSREMCGGTLLTPAWVLTAAHCLKPENIDNVRVTVRAGFNAPSQLIQIRHMSRAIPHENYQPPPLNRADDLRYDIAMLKVNQPFKLSPVAQPAELPRLGTLASCRTVLAAGIGLTRTDENPPAVMAQLVRRPLLCVDLRVIDDVAVCRRDLGNSVIDETVFCASETGKDTCTGDSGGPVTCRGVVVGIVSYGPEDCGAPEGTATYTKVERYLDFIDGVIKSKRGNTIRAGAHSNISRNNSSKSRFLPLVWLLTLLTQGTVYT